MPSAFDRLYAQAAEREYELCDQANRIMAGLRELEAHFLETVGNTQCGPFQVMRESRLAVARIAEHLVAAEHDFLESLRDYCRRRGRDFDARGEFIAILAVKVFKPH